MAVIAGLGSAQVADALEVYIMHEIATRGSSGVVEGFV